MQYVSISDCPERVTLLGQPGLRRRWAPGAAATLTSLGLTMNQQPQDPQPGTALPVSPVSPADIQDDAGTGLTISWARTIEDVVEAWQLVYQACRRSGMIAPNHQRLFTLPRAVGRQSLVLQGRLDIQTVTTLTAVADGPEGLPLDAEDGALLAGLRGGGRRVMEVCLVGDRRDRLSRTLQAKRAMMRLALGYARTQGIGDVVLLAAAEDAHLYHCEYGFEPLAARGNQPETLPCGRMILHLNVGVAAQSESCPPGLAWCRQHPVAPGVFTARFDFDSARVGASPLGEFLRGHALAACPPDAPPYGTSPTAA
jgi:hypothetical protein